MAESFAWGLLAGSSLVVGGLIALTVPLSRRVLGLVMAFGAGVLISAVAFELVQEAHDTSAGDGGVGLGLLLGATVFFVGDTLIDARGGAGRKASMEARPTARRWRSFSASCSTASPNRSCWG